MTLVAQPDPDAALHQFVGMLDALRSGEGDSITLLCDNPDGPPNNAVEACGAWTAWESRRFEGETLRAAVAAAHAAFVEETR